MAPHFWASADQLTFLRSHLEAYIQAQKDRIAKKFREEVTYIWFQKWPEDKPNTGDSSKDDQQHGQAIQKRKDQIRNWFKNNHDKTSKKQTTFVIQAKPQRRRQVVELYFQDVYLTKLKPAILVEIKETNVPRGRVMALMRLRTREAFEREPEEVREHYAKLAEEQPKKGCDAHEEASTPESYASGLRSAPGFAQTALEELSRRTGWKWSAHGIGPDPLDGGRLRIISVHCGTNFLGQTFPDADPRTNEDHLKALIQFGKTAWTPGDCAGYALKKQALDDGGLVETQLAPNEVLKEGESVPNETLNETGSTPDLASAAAYLAGHAQALTQLDQLSTNPDLAFASDDDEFNDQLDFNDQDFPVTIDIQQELALAAKDIDMNLIDPRLRPPMPGPTAATPLPPSSSAAPVPPPLQAAAPPTTPSTAANPVPPHIPVPRPSTVSPPPSLPPSTLPTPSPTSTLRPPPPSHPAATPVPLPTALLGSTPLPGATPLTDSVPTMAKRRKRSRTSTVSAATSPLPAPPAPAFPRTPEGAILSHGGPGSLAHGTGGLGGGADQINISARPPSTLAIKSAVTAGAPGIVTDVMPAQTDPPQPPEERARRIRKPAGRKEVVPLTGTAPNAHPAKRRKA